MRCTTRVRASGVEGGGLTIAVLPASSACGRAAPRIAIGQLNGTMSVTTPSGWYDTVVSTGMPGTTASTLPVSTSSASISARFQRISKTSESIHDSKRILPFSCERIAASSSRASAMPSSAARICSARSVADSADHAGKAAFAAATASSTSCAVADAARPTIRPGLPGSATSRASMVCRSSPPMYRPVLTSAAVAIVSVIGHTSLSFVFGSGSTTSAASASARRRGCRGCGSSRWSSCPRPGPSCAPPGVHSTTG